MSEQYSRDNTKRETIRKSTEIELGTKPDEPIGLLSAICALVQKVFHFKYKREHVHEIEHIDREEASSSIRSEQREQLTKDRTRATLADNQRIHDAKRLAAGGAELKPQPASPEEQAKAAAELEAYILELRAKGYTVEAPDDRPPGTDPDEPRP